MPTSALLSCRRTPGQNDAGMEQEWLAGLITRKSPGASPGPATKQQGVKPVLAKTDPYGASKAGRLMRVELELEHPASGNPDEIKVQTSAPRVPMFDIIEQPVSGLGHRLFLTRN